MRLPLAFLFSAMVVLSAIIHAGAAEPFKSALDKATAGSAKWQYFVGWAYLNGPWLTEKDNRSWRYQIEIALDEIPAKNFAEAAKWLSLSANQKYAPAQELLGSHMEKGFGPVRSNPAAGLALIRNAAAQGHRQALVDMTMRATSQQERLYWAILEDEHGGDGKSAHVVILTSLLTVPEAKKALADAAQFKAVSACKEWSVPMRDPLGGELLLRKVVEVYEYKRATGTK